ncbi:MAG: threonine ammonia-lyase, biosynthetic [Spirochaetes bacterium]|nr:threonine ammonia-lyase, biosynthetic [Spirochaetota bacterium]
MFISYIKRILKANVYDVAIETPINKAYFLSKRFKNNILIKREDLQPVYSFKLRGAYNKMIQLPIKKRQRGVMAASAGNHAQGVALAAKKMGIHATIVMPKTTPEIKVQSVREYGAEVVLHGDTYDEAYNYARGLAQQKKVVLIHPYDDPDVIAGQGTIGMEILRQHSGPLHAIFVPVGGGGLIAGISVFVKYMRPDIKIIGVEAEESACLQAALKMGWRVKLPKVGIFADGVAVSKIGREPFRIVRTRIDSVVTVSTDEICAAIKDIFDDTRSITEPAGALALAGLKKYVERNKFTDKTLLAINSGANVNFDRLRHIAERSELGEKREAILGVTISEESGSFRKFCEDLGNHNITEFNYRYSDPVEAHIFVGVQLDPGCEGLNGIIINLTKKGYKVVDLTDNELSKVHIRYMVGGRTTGIQNESLYRFEFPERPGAIFQFLNAMGTRWNISLFHYRNHGAAYGRVLMGLQVPPQDKNNLKMFLKESGYRFFKDSNNPAYKLFLS